MHRKVTFSFKKDKYERETLLDCGVMSKTKGFVKNHTPFDTSFHELFFITAGRGIFRLSDKNINFQKGTILLLPPERRRQWVMVEEDFDGYILIFEEEFITHFFNDALFLFRFHYFYNSSTPSFIKPNEDQFVEMIAKLKEIQVELKELRGDSHHFLRSLLYYLLIQINRIYEKEFGLKDILYQNDVTLRFRRLLEKHIATTHKVADYAEMLNVSKSHLNKRLKRYFGKSCSTIIKERLIIEIKKSLLFSDKTVAEIAYHFNFSEPGNFIRFFKKMTHITPHKYRLSNSN